MQNVSETRYLITNYKEIKLHFVKAIPNINGHLFLLYREPSMVISLFEDAIAFCYG